MTRIEAPASGGIDAGALACALLAPLPAVLHSSALQFARLLEQYRRNGTRAPPLDEVALVDLLQRAPAALERVPGWLRDLRDRRPEQLLQIRQHLQAALQPLHGAVSSSSQLLLRFLVQDAPEVLVLGALLGVHALSHTDTLALAGQLARRTGAAPITPTDSPSLAPAPALGLASGELGRVSSLPDLASLRALADLEPNAAGEASDPAGGARFALGDRDSSSSDLPASLLGGIQTEPPSPVGFFPPAADQGADGHTSAKCYAPTEKLPPLSDSEPEDTGSGKPVLGPEDEVYDPEMCERNNMHIKALARLGYVSWFVNILFNQAANRGKQVPKLSKNRGCNPRIRPLAPPRAVVPENHVCVICIEDVRLTHLSVQLYFCGHVFHSGCMVDLLQSNPIAPCPCCRTPLHPKERRVPRLTLNDSELRTHIRHMQHQAQQAQQQRSRAQT
ncbi:hypothetical protein H696_00405 [Fonticula alba]|uniref:RING-type domain-containing protein n=1 Tax=Fonticula alba TaxID=691883 RepID=A0A058ZEN2_FONAL|nr:hypothetical protein H696_00405 [Fonticula alba]KCV72829.1 hypothetical protein H696_00405 [Fonticula alba]|eukprot:XP_009492530.1 hypothetical protein H696_00405 [Fonticula alba]